MANIDRVQAGDSVICYHGFRRLRALVVTPGSTFQCKDGIFSHTDMVGVQYGTSVVGRKYRPEDPIPSLVILRHTPELWTQAVAHRTQIIYLTDISVIIQLLRLRSGSMVAEAGTGSGSLTHALARVVAPTGKVFTFDFHKLRMEEAREEFVRNGLKDVVVSGWRDVCTPSATSSADTQNSDRPQCGFGLPQSSVDAVFLDVPSPWSAVSNVLEVLRVGGIFCTFSPCIEQTQRHAMPCEHLDSSWTYTQWRRCQETMFP